LIETVYFYYYGITALRYTNVRRTVMSSKKVYVQKQRSIPVYKKVDVVVAGGGPGGIGAAISAARNGADTLLVERHSFPGGMATASLQNWWGGSYDIPMGISREITLKLNELGAAKWIERGRFPPPATGVAPLTYHISFDPETFKFVVFDMLEAAGARLLTNTMAVDAIVEGKKVKGIIIENKSGRQAIMADVVIDATGDADIAARAGAPIDRLPESGLLMSMILLFRMGGINYPKIAEYARQHPEDFRQGTGVPPGEFDGENHASISGFGGWASFTNEAKKKGELPADFRSGWGNDGFSICGVSPQNIKNGVGYFDIFHVWKVFPWNADDVMHAELEARKRIRTFVEWVKKVPGFENSFLIDIAHSIGLQDSRRIIGEYMLTRKDEYEGKIFDDDISLITNTWWDVPVGEYNGWIMHPADGSQGDEKYRRQTEGATYLQVVFGVPYRCLIPKGFDGILVAGQTIGMTYMAHEPGTCRNMTTCTNFGQGAGTAAALAVKNKVSVRDVDIKTLQKTLESQGMVLRKELIDNSEITRMIEARGVKIGHRA
jgi:ribulose 1,5-bisphosphate synthetase/thiazole synthase